MCLYSRYVIWIRLLLLFCLQNKLCNKILHNTGPLKSFSIMNYYPDFKSRRNDMRSEFWLEDWKFPMNEH